MTNQEYPRDLVGYGSTPPQADWPGGAKLALQFVINYEEGGENNILHGDLASESFLSEIIGADARENVRHMSMESFYEYGSRVRVWRLFELFRSREIPVTLFAIAMAMERHPAVIENALENGFEICSHGWKWIDYQYISEEIEREHMEKAIEIHQKITGEAPKGWYTGRTSPNTRKLVVEHGGFVYDADDYNDELPFWTIVNNKEHLVVPYSLDANDMRFATNQGFNSGDQFYSYLRDTFDVLYKEGEQLPRMMSVGIHCRIAGRPGRFKALEKFVDYAREHKDVWFCRRIDIAEHWKNNHPFIK